MLEYSQDQSPPFPHNHISQDAENGTILSLLASTLADCLNDDFSTGCMCESDMQNRQKMLEVASSPIVLV